jgi:menaquinone-dependent protoporphyrinogen oxidase
MTPRVLVVYGTTEGHTRKIAHRLADALEEQGVTVHVFEAREGVPAPDGYAGVVVAASVHAGGYQRPVRRWVHTHRAALNGKPAVFVSVCLGILQHDDRTQRDLARIVERFAAETGWRPATVKHVAGALPYTRYGWLRRAIMKRIVARAGGDTDTSRDYEYTDWTDVRRMAAGFAQQLLTAAPRAVRSA